MDDVEDVRNGEAIVKAIPVSDGNDRLDEIADVGFGPLLVKHKRGGNALGNAGSMNGRQRGGALACTAGQPGAPSKLNHSSEAGLWPSGIASQLTAAACGAGWAGCMGQH